MAITTAGSTPGISLTLTIRKQWNGAFDGEISLTNTGSNALSQWSVSFVSRYALNKVSNFSLQQSQQADGTWLITLRPPSWGTTLLPNRASRSYLQGALPSGTSLSAPARCCSPAAAAGAAPLLLRSPRPLQLQRRRRLQTRLQLLAQRQHPRRPQPRHPIRLLAPAAAPPQAEVAAPQPPPSPPVA